MKQEDKELLLKDLCARLPYGIKILCLRDFDYKWYNLEAIDLDENDVYITSNYTDTYKSGYVKIEDIKPYLFPLSSMTEEQWNNAPRVNLTEFTFESLKCGCFTLASYTCENDLCDLVEFINWLIENHFDIYGLIPKNLAIDCTNLNIY